MSLSKLMYKKLNMDQLIKFAQQNDLKALEELIKREQKHIQLTFMYLCKDSEKVSDLTQEALFRMANHISDLRKPKTFKSWLNHIVMNLFYDDLRKCTKVSTISYDKIPDDENYTTNPALEIPDKHAKPLENCLSCELELIIKNEILNLPENFRVPIVLREFQGFSYDEIAKSTNTNVGTVKSRIARARLKLKENLKSYINKGV